MQVAVERTVGLYKITVTGEQEELETILRTVEDVTRAMSRTSPIKETIEPAEHVSTEVPAISRSNRLSDAISELFTKDWGIEPRGIGEIKDALATNGLIYPLTTLSGTLLSLTKRGLLRRIKTSDGYRYVRGANL
ncbi:MAG TPA: hypothetical protein VGR53_02325 [Nitrososphaerales archaeon]|nr:hypothetical protein [Nitrososphaerales archaeon]